jgi:type II pantothenate kinase
MRRLYESRIVLHAPLPEGAAGIDAGLTLTKVVRASGGTIEAFAFKTAAEPARDIAERDPGRPLGVTGARAPAYAALPGAVESQEIAAAARGARALLSCPGASDEANFVLALLGTGTAFAAVRGDNVQHLGGTPLGGGSFAGIARRIDPVLTYETMIAGAARGDRRRADVMVSDAYPDGIGRIGGEMTAAHLAKRGDETPDDVLAALLNLHGENIAQIAASRAIIAQIPRLVLAGGFAHENAALVTSITAMAALFGVAVDLAPYAGFAGAIGAAILAGGKR